MTTAVLIPAYQPDDRLPALVDDLTAAGANLQVVVVDDGSGPAYQAVFDAVLRLGATVIAFAGNRGKGAALKAGLRHVAAHLPGSSVVCADADGQHRVRDILAVARRVQLTGRMVLGTRQFTGDVPVRSRAGNAVTRVLFAAATRCPVTDTQTGLRGYPPTMLGWLAAVPGERYEYEMNALLFAARTGEPIEQVSIATIYLDHNASSHFRPLVDSARIYTPLLMFSASSVLAFLVDLVVLLVVHAATGALLPAALCARLVSATTNFAVNRRFVFGHRSRGGWRVAAAGYWTLAGVLFAANYAVIATLTDWGIALLPAKVVTEIVLFAVSYVVQQRVVFAPAGSVPGPPPDVADDVHVMAAAKTSHS